MNDETMLLRQVNPSFIQSGRVTSQVFSPTPKDDNKLSCYDGDLITAPNSHQHFTETLGFRSSGVLGVTVKECVDLELPSRPDPEPFPEHAVIDFEGKSKREIERKAKELRGIATTRGYQFEP